MCATAVIRSAIIRAEGLRKLYGSTEALSDLSFEIAEGEVFGFIGENGAGKTTTLRILAGLTRPSGGWAEVDGVDVTTERARLHELVGYMPDFFGVYDSMTAAEYLAFYASCYRLPKHVIDRVTADLLELVHLSDKQEAQVNTLSRGMKQRLCLARALVHDPKVLLLDEPASGLDPRARTEMRELVQALREMGKTIVLSSHILPELAEMCSSYGIIHDGRMVASGPARAILDNLGPRRAKARVVGSLDAAERVAGAIAGVSNVRRAGVDTLEIELAGERADDPFDAAGLLGALVAAGVPVADFREDDGGLEQLFLQLTAPGPVPGEAGELIEAGEPIGPGGPGGPVEPVEQGR
jgi:ABC-2 type transport system ATP-binding protein